MIDLEVSARYGKTLFLGLKKEERKKALSELYQWLPTLTKPALQPFFVSPIIPLNKKEEVLGAILEGKVTPFLLSYLKFLLRKERFKDLEEIAKQLSKLVQEEEGELFATLTTTIPLSDENRNTLLARLKNTFHKDLILKEKIDPKLLGGAILKVGNTLWDGSIQGKLHSLEEQLI